MSLFGLSLSFPLCFGGVDYPRGEWVSKGEAGSIMWNRTPLPHSSASLSGSGEDVALHEEGAADRIQFGMGMSGTHIKEYVRPFRNRCQQKGDRDRRRA